MNTPPSDVNESLWRRQPSDAERAELRMRPELELEARLTEALSRIPEAPVPSNFTARILNAVEREEAGVARPGRRWNWRALLPRVAVATALLILAGIGVQHHEVRSHRVQLAKNVARLAATQPPPSVDALENFDVIQRLGASTHADGELLATLQ